VLAADAADPNIGAMLHAAAVQAQWDLVREPVQLPGAFCLLMGDVQGGSSTPSMVSICVDMAVVSYSVRSHTQCLHEHSPGDVHNGSTVKFQATIKRPLLCAACIVQVKAVLKWRTADATKAAAAQLWEQLSQVNVDIRDLLQQLRRLDSTDLVMETCEHLASVAPSDWDEDLSAAARCMCDLKEGFVHARELLKRMGDEAGVPIEPDEQVRCNCI
jgi:phosphomevalonate kinase